MSGSTAPSVPRVGSGIAGAAVMIAVVTVAARVAGFARILVFARTVGPSCLGDAYFTANTIPNIVFDVVAGGALASIVVPVLAGPVVAGERSTVDRTSSALLTWSMALLVPVALLGALLAHPLMSLLVGGGQPGCEVHRQVDIGARMLVVFMPQVVLYGLGIVATGILQAHRRFLGPALGPLTSSLVVIAAYLAFGVLADRRETDLSTLTRSHELILSVGTTLGVLALVAPLLPPLVRTRIRVRPTLHFPPGVAGTVRRMALSGAVVLGSQDLATAVVLRLANDQGSAGSVVLYNLAWTVFLLPWAVLAVPLATSAFPTLTSRWEAGERVAYAAATAASIRVVVVATAGAAAMMAAAAGPAARLVVLGAPGHVDPQVLARGLVGFAPGVVGFGLLAVLSRAMYAQRDARAPAIATAVGWFIAIGCDVALVAALPATWTVFAVGLGSSVGISVAALALALRLRRSAGAAAVRGAARSGAAAGAGALATAGMGAAVARALAPSSLPACLLAGAAVAALVAVGYVLALRWWDADTVRLTASRLPIARLRIRRG